MANADKKIEDLLANDSFIRWLEGKASPGEQTEWQTWLRNDPARKKLVKEAGRIHRSFRLSPTGNPSTEMELSRLNFLVDEYEVSQKNRSTPPARRAHKQRKYGFTRAVAIAAVFLITILSAALFFYQMPPIPEETEPSFVTTQTTNGQKKVLTLSGGSSITLQANSSLRHPATDINEIVEFRLEGEAYFDINPDSDDRIRTYRVYTQDGLAEVMGTKFNVNTFKTGTEVVLEEGKLRIEVANSLRSTGAEHIMAPGEWNRFVYNGETIDTKPVEVEIFTSWTQDKLIFDRTPLKDIADRIRHIYGVDVSISDPELQQVELSGSVPNDNLPVLLNALESILNRPLTNDNGVIRM